MKFLADENFPRPAVKALRDAGFDVEWILEGQSGASDEEVLARSAADRRTLLTFDKDFGELAFRRQLPGQFGIVLFRFVPSKPDGHCANRCCRYQFTGKLGRVLQRREAGQNSYDPVTRRTLIAG